MKNILQDIIKQAIDVHVHIGPEIIPRKYTVESLVDTERGKIAGMILKNHFYPTMPFVTSNTTKTNIKLYGGVVLNNAIGGLNEEAVYASALLSDKPLMVWFPTINAKQFLDNSTYEIAPEWVRQKNFRARNAKGIRPVPVMRNSRITNDVKKVLQMIKKVDAVLATGHISWKESVVLIAAAQQIGIKRIVVTHPIYQRIAMPVSMQKELVASGCFMEQSFSMYSIDKIPIRTIAEQIRAVGAKGVILSSDMGQLFSPSPSQALFRFAKLLQREGIGTSDLFTMLVTNPKELLYKKNKV